MIELSELMMNAPLLKYSEDQPRDEQGQWTDDGENPSTPKRIAATFREVGRTLAARDARVDAALDIHPDGYKIKARRKTWTKQTIAGDVFWTDGKKYLMGRELLTEIGDKFIEPHVPEGTLRFSEKVAKGGTGSGEQEGHPFRGNQYTGGSYSAAEKVISDAKAEGRVVLFHSGNASTDADQAYYGIEPRFGPWLEEVLSGATDDEDTMREIRDKGGAAFYSEEPKWVSMKVARFLNKPVQEVTVDDILKHGQLSIVVADPDSIDFKRTDEQGRVRSLAGEVVGYEVPFGVESKDVYSTETVAPDITLTGKNLLRFLVRNYPNNNILAPGESLSNYEDQKHFYFGKGGAGSGDVEGHPFRGNQWTGGYGDGDIEEGKRPPLQFVSDNELRNNVGSDQQFQTFLDEPLTSRFMSPEEKSRELKQHVEETMRERMEKSPDTREYAYFCKNFLTPEGQGSGTYERQLVATWAECSMDDNEVAVLLQRAAAEEFGLDDASLALAGPDSTRDLDAKFEEPKTENTVARDHNGDPLDSVKAMKGARAFLREMYNDTQERFKEAGIKELVIFRGFHVPGTVTDQWRNVKWDGNEDHPSTTTQDLAMQPMSAWSTNAHVAQDFMDLEDIREEFDRGVLMIAKVPVERVIATPRTGFGCRGEVEVVVLGGTEKIYLAFGPSGVRSTQYVSALMRGKGMRF
jgi:hypothetical protein